MGKTYRQLEAKVRRRVTRPVLQELEREVKKKVGKLWATRKGRNFVREQLVLALYKDLQNKGYNTVHNDTHAWTRCSSKTLRHNTKIVREAAAVWAMKQIKLGDSRSWNRAAEGLDVEGPAAASNLWLDSVDLPKEGKRTTSRSGPDWSWKVNGPGRRYMCLSDGRGRARQLWGGYSPKVFDGSFVELFVAWFKKHLLGGVIVADQHFEWGKKHLRNPKFLTPFKTPGEPKDDAKGLPTLTKEQKGYNRSVRTARARVETVFGCMTKKFRCLQHPWRESDEQLDNVVKLAAGLVTVQAN